MYVISYISITIKRVNLQQANSGNTQDKIYSQQYKWGNKKIKLNRYMNGNLIVLLSLGLCLFLWNQKSMENIEYNAIVINLIMCDFFFSFY